MEVSPRLRVRVTMLEQRGDRATVRVDVEDDQGRPFEGAARVATPGSDPVPLELAGPGELVIHDLSVQESTMVELITPDGEGMVIWLDGGEVEADEDYPNPWAVAP